MTARRCVYCGRPCAGRACHAHADLTRIERVLHGDLQGIKDAARPRAARPQERYRVTSHARVQCDCGVYVYTEQRGNHPPALPANCWRCEAPLDAARSREAVQATKGKGR